MMSRVWISLNTKTRRELRETCAKSFFVASRYTTAKMSDYEDDMDVDVPAGRDTLMFSSDNTSKGKRSAANLPVEAEDSLPW